MNDIDLDRALVTFEVTDTLERMPQPGDLSVLATNSRLAYTDAAQATRSLL
jgi:hypothetical protein